MWKRILSPEVYWSSSILASYGPLIQPAFWGRPSDILAPQINAEKINSWLQQLPL